MKSKAIDTESNVLALGRDLTLSQDASIDEAVEDAELLRLAEVRLNDGEPRIRVNLEDL